MLYLGSLAKDATRSIYDMRTSKEIVNIHQEEIDGTVFLRVEPKNFLSDNHIEEYEIWLTMLENKIKAEENTKGKPIALVKNDDEDFEKAIQNLYPNHHLTKRFYNLDRDLLKIK